MLRRMVEGVIRGGRRKGYRVVVPAVLKVLLLLAQGFEEHALKVVLLLVVRVCLLLEEMMALRNRSVVDRGLRAWMEAGREEESKLMIAVLYLGQKLSLGERSPGNNLCFVPWPLMDPLAFL